MPGSGDQMQIVLSESNFRCIREATAKGSPVRSAVDMASEHARLTGNVNAGDKVVITCNEAQAEELLRLAQVSCRPAMQEIAVALAEARERRPRP